MYGSFTTDRKIILQIFCTVMQNYPNFLAGHSSLELGVAASFLEFSHLGNDRQQRLSSDFVAQSAATFGFKRSHTDTKATATGTWKGAVRECTPHAVCSRDVTLL